MGIMEDARHDVNCKLIESMLRRIAAVIAVRGEHTKY